MRIGNKYLMQDYEAYLDGKNSFEVEVILDSAYNRSKYPDRKKDKQSYSIVDGKKVKKYTTHNFVQTKVIHKKRFKEVSSFLIEKLDIMEEIYSKWKNIKDVTDYALKEHETYIIYDNN